MKINKRRYMVFLFLALVPILLFLNSCKPKAYSGKNFSYPPNSKPHESNWKYRGFVKITSNKSGAFSQQSDKYIHISVTDRKSNSFLNDKFEFNCGGIDVMIKWDHFEKLEIILNEVGSEHVNDHYNKQLIKEGPRKLIVLEYNFDLSLKKFVRR